MFPYKAKTLKQLAELILDGPNLTVRMNAAEELRFRGWVGTPSQAAKSILKGNG